MLNLNTPIEKLSRVGPKSLPRLKKLGIKTVKDLLWHFPFRYEDYRQITPISLVKKDEAVNIRGTIMKIDSQRSWKKRMAITTALVEDDSDIIKAVWFNQPYLEETLPAGSEVSLAGKIKLAKGGLYLASPVYEKITARTENTGLTHTGRLVPLYPETEGLSSKYLRFLLRPLMDCAKNIPDPLPAVIVSKYQFPPLNQAIKEIHFPASLAQAEAAKKRIAFSELFFFQLKSLVSRRQILRLKSHPVRFEVDFVKSLVSSLPFTLTDDQRLCLFEILKDMEKKYPMNRLLNGDVGSGKTVVALIAAGQVALQKKQAVLMAPTEILARQHFETAVGLLGRWQTLSPVQFYPAIALLTGSEASWFRTDPVFNSRPEKISKKELKEKIATGEIDIVIGTHAVIQKNITFKNLALAIVDEQHRFGVRQRAELVGRRPNADLTQTNVEEDKKNIDSLLYEEVTYKIRKCIFKVKKNLGLGHKENIYQKALEIEFTNQNIPFEKEKNIDIRYDSKKVGLYRPDFVIEDKIIVELKALPFLGNIEKRQVWTYLKGSSYKLALLVNFGSDDVTINRIIYDISRKSPPSAFSQRESALCPHLLSMTATPIPRTLALTIYGDLDISLIKEKPKNRKKIMTKVFNSSGAKTAYGFIDKELSAGRQAFVICPRIEVSSLNANYQPPTADYRLSLKKALWQEVKAVTQEYEKLSKEIFPHRRIAMLHGKMRPKDKEKTMRDFKNKKYDLLVATSVVEVGMDIPNASVMLIENAERFGLAQLHQFRGRVGRAEHQSYCLLVNGGGMLTENRRLRALETHDDGFTLAEQDLRLRGPGEFVGTKQSGLPDLAMASLTDLDLIKKARLEARLLLKEDPALMSYPLLRNRLSEMQRLVHFE